MTLNFQQFKDVSLVAVRSIGWASLRNGCCLQSNSDSDREQSHSTDNRSGCK
jgi:hypothetical protein